jgi:hypothetical protein
LSRAIALLANAASATTIVNNFFIFSFNLTLMIDGAKVLLSFGFTAHFCMKSAVFPTFLPLHI